MSDRCKVGAAAVPRKSAVILAGAAGKGPFAAGALGVLAKHLAEFELVCVVGTSSGALNAAVFAAGLRVGRGPKAAELLEGLWRDTATACNILTQGMREKIVKDALQTFSGYAQTSHVKLRIALTNLNGNEAFANRCHYTTYETVRHFEGADFVTEKGMQTIARHSIASAAIPFIFPPVRLDGTTYVDGGFVDNAPIAWALQQDEAIEDLIVVTSDPRVAARPRCITRFPGRSVLNAILRERLTRDLLEAYSFNEELKKLAALGVDMQRVRRELKWRPLKIIEIRPPRETSGGFVSGFFHKNERIRNLDAGRSAAAKAFEDRARCPAPAPCPAPPPRPVAPVPQSQHLRKSSELLLIAPIKKGLVPVPPTVTYATRLEMLLGGLFAIRQVGIERNAGLSNLIGPLETVTSLHFVQWAILDGGTRLLLAVTFEGPWEAYIRDIVDKAGPFLDSIFCHCVGYTGGPESYTTADGYDAFARWVRAHQVPVTFLHSAAPDISANDIAWLRKLDELRARPALAFATEATELRYPFPAPPEKADFAPATTFMEVLSAFFVLSEFFPPPDNVFLQRAASKQLLLLNPCQKPLKEQGGAIQDAWDWYEQYVLPLRKAVVPPAAEKIRAPSTIQGNILTGYDSMADGRLVFVQFISPAAGAQFVRGFNPTVDGCADAFTKNIALTFAGFNSLGLGDLPDLPEEFREGMETRAPMLGDVGLNHPYFWERPAADGAPGAKPPRIDLSTIDAVVTFQWLGGAGAPLEGALAAIVGPPGAPTGVRILATQNLHRNHPGPRFVAHFGFVDGISQPVPKRSDQGIRSRDEVALGELLLGYVNAKGEKPRLANPDVFTNGSFLAMRKIRQDVEGFEQFLDSSSAGGPASRDTVAGKIMGRHLDGKSLALGVPLGVTNDFDYMRDRAGNGCPLSSHVRRANPRVDGIPRILRRGFSYSDSVPDDVGLVFMAYCASLGSQYELIQKWVNGGNSTGIYGRQVDPISGVPNISNSKYYFPNEGAPVTELPMPATPLLTLKWGLYLFAPSTEGLAEIGRLALEAAAQEEAARKAPPASGKCPFSGGAAQAKAAAIRAAGAAALEQIQQVDPATGLDQWRVWVEEQDVATQEEAAAVFAALRAQPEFEPTPYGILVSREQDSFGVYGDDNYSVCEYGKRMTASYGLLTLGQDRGPAYAAAAPAPNNFIAGISRADAYEAALAIGRAGLGMAPVVDQPGTPANTRRIVDLGVWADQVFCQLVERWFGFPDPTVMRKGGTAAMSRAMPCCPDDFRVVSGYIFQPQPTVAQSQAAVLRGALIARAGAAYTKTRRAALAGGAPVENTLIDTLLRDGYMGGDDDATSRAWIGAVSGFAVPTGGTFERSVGVWLEKGTFWRIQQGYLASVALQPPGALDVIDENKGALRAPLAVAVIESLQAVPVPFALHRRVKENREVRPGVTATPDTPVVIVTTSVGNELLEKESLEYAAIFGGRFQAAKPPGSALHACPGRELALGVIMGLAAAVFERSNVASEGPISVSFDA